MLEINYDTKLLGVVGENISYTLSPAIHNYSFQELGINAVYLAFDIKSDEFKEIFPGLVKIAYGLNITIPYKEIAIKYVEAQSEAKRIGAINTIFNGKGYNTDYIAIKSLVQERIDKFETCTIFGAGGAARAAIFALHDLGCSINVINRSKEKAEKLIEEMRDKNIEIKIRYNCKSDIIVNSTPNPDFVPDECVNSKLVIDFVYKPVITSLIKRAQNKNIKTINGIEILVRQAMEAEKIWFGKSLKDEEVVNYLYARKLIW
ncbi:shikimate dehydrogenase family protein [Sulfurisphaera ohwakuensis]|uniref:shikimate dehydrogenase family protein n=1 Tax=Sulfurisphaera ohwakuensis TaxID=69656 RepID=UPI0036F41968